MQVTFSPSINVAKINATKHFMKGQRIEQYNSKSIIDSISFSGKIRTHKIDVDMETANFVANSLSSSTAGHRAIYGSKTFSPEVVKLLTLGTAKYVKDTAKRNGEKPKVIVGGDTRKATRESIPLITKTLQEQGIDVTVIKDPVPSPLLAMMAQQDKVDLSFLLTASHNPWEYGGFNLVTKDGAIAPQEITKEIAQNAIDIAKQGRYITDRRYIGVVEEKSPYEMYKKTINSYEIIDWNKIKNSSIEIYYDDLQGTGGYIFPKLLKENGIELKKVKSIQKEGPNPTKENLRDLRNAVKDTNSKLTIGLSNDGDADRFGIIDENGTFIDPNDVLLLVSRHLVKNKGIKGTIVRSQATSSQLDIFANNNGIEVSQTPVGFKYLGSEILRLRKEGKDILVSGEESGGLTMNKHIPEKDGILADLVILDLMATENKPLSEILKDTKAELNTEFRAKNYSVELSTDEEKEKVITRMENIYDHALTGDIDFGGYTIDVEKTKENKELMESHRPGGDGIKLYFTDGSTVLIRKSGTEPKIRVYIETYNDSSEIADNNIIQLNKELSKVLDVNTPYKAD